VVDRDFIDRAGEPTATIMGGMSRVTTEPAPMTGTSTDRHAITDRTIGAYPYVVSNADTAPVKALVGDGGIEPVEFMIGWNHYRMSCDSHFGTD
jgi:hypothetical protein